MTPAVPAAGYSKFSGEEIESNIHPTQVSRQEFDEMAKFYDRKMARLRDENVETFEEINTENTDDGIHISQQALSETIGLNLKPGTIVISGPSEFPMKIWNRVVCNKHMDEASNDDVETPNPLNIENCNQLRKSQIYPQLPRGRGRSKRVIQRTYEEQQMLPSDEPLEVNHNLSMALNKEGEKNNAEALPQEARNRHLKIRQKALKYNLVDRFTKTLGAALFQYFLKHIGHCNRHK